MRWTNRLDWLKRLPPELLGEQFLWRAFHLFLLSLVVFLLVVSWMSWLETRLRPPVRVETAIAQKQRVEIPGDESSEERPSLQEYRRSIAEDLFGAEDEGEQEEEQDEAPLEEIPLSQKDLHLKLVGTIVLGDPRSNIAVIEDTRSGEQEMYTAGDRIEEIRIESVLRDNVVITSSGEKRVLTMQFERLRERGGQRSRVQERGSSSASSATTRTISKEYVQRSLQDMSGLMQSALIRPYQQGGETVGFQLDNIQSGSFYDRIGLNDGDVITSIGDMELKSPQQLMEFSRELRTRDRVTMTLRRNGRERRIEYRLR